MAKAVQKATLPQWRGISFDKLALSQSNVRRIKAGALINELAKDIARRELLEGSNVRSMVHDDGVETAMFAILASCRALHPRALSRMCRAGRPRGRGALHPHA